MDVQEIRKRVEEINQNDVDSELSVQAGMQSYISELYIQAEMSYRLLKGKKYDDLRAKMEGEGKKVTEKMVEMAMLSNEELQMARAKRDALKSLKDSISSRGQMLIQLAINKRQDLESQVGKIAV